MDVPFPFADFFFALRKAGLKVGLGDFMGVLDALKKDVVAKDLEDFYFISRALLVKSENSFDIFDQVFARVFGGATAMRTDMQQLLDWLKDPKAPKMLTPEQLAALEKLPFDELMKRLQDRLKEQRERHDGGNRFIGTGGTSPFGNAGMNPAGVRIGSGGGGRSAVQVAEERRFRDYRDDVVLDERAMAVALKRLRKLSRRDALLELDVDESIDATCKNAGELELVFKPPRKNQARVLLLMDTGGSMDPFADLVEQLFTAATKTNHWKKFEAFAFHNCVYEKIYTRIAEEKGLPTSKLLDERPPETFLIMVGDAYMAPYELTERFGAISLSHQNNTPGIVWLHRLRQRFANAVWLNPMPERSWASAWTIKTIGEIIPMFPLTLKGLDEAVKALVAGHPPPLKDLDPRWAQSA
ncbi:MAG: VWA domain-containing protein [Deltaproteobacteria bacterium]|nr:VWA domain-containing protein [Deltaproteobacteria bacterium]